jgi:glycosyltransferase involved in cell wall biosynthesis
MFEALVSKKYLVSSIVGGIPEVVENRVDEVLVAPADVKELCNTVCRTVNDSNSTVKQLMECKARQKIVLNYTWKRLITEFVNVFRSL